MSKNKPLFIKVIFISIFILSFITVLIAIFYLASIKKPSSIQRSIPPKVSINCPSTISDIDNNVYKTVQIGSQCWMKENLKVARNPKGESITRYCYDNDPQICKTDGGLYDWDTTMNGSNEEGAQGICPDGWHVPTDKEWHALESGLAEEKCDADRNGSGCSPAGEKLKVGGSSGFEAIPGGFYGNENNSFGFRGTLALFWSSTENLNPTWKSAWMRSLYLSKTPSYLKGKSRRGIASQSANYSLRCLKN